MRANSSGRRLFALLAVCTGLPAASASATVSGEEIVEASGMA